MKISELTGLLREDIQFEDLYRLYRDEEEERNAEITPEKKVARLLYELTLSPSYKGYKYLKEAILMLCDEDISYNSFTKNIYPLIAEKHNTTAQNIEKNIRFAIRKIYDSNTPEELEKYLGKTSIIYTNPSNVKFITYCAEKLRLER
ncbi:MAG: sporulation initiation factor Spo0A C-terminal domain-containing protein [Firmicutes bacterium]|nr:sporulation initiation factor Spo0A C-terminal domain-containing protein [Bacillota bacterium]